MTFMSRALVVAALLSCSLAGQVLAAVPSPSSDPLRGSWSLDTSRLPMPPDQRPRSVNFSFADDSEGKWTTHVDIVYASGEQVHSVATAPLDGTYAVIKDSPEADYVALRQPAPNVLVMALQQAGTLVSTRVYSVTPDGGTLVETVVYPGNDSTRVMRANYFRRVR